MAAEIKDGVLVIDEIPIIKEDGTFIINDGLYHVAKDNKLWPLLHQEYEKRPKMFKPEEPVRKFTKKELEQSIRSERDIRLNISDRLVAPDRPCANAEKGRIHKYRQALRDLPAQKGFPWDGGGPKTPWPVL